jgi:ArsR family metal-binding transcriptional regulator
MADDKEYRTISREYPDGSRIITVVKNTGEADERADEELLDRLEEHFEHDRRNGYSDSE